MLRFVPVDTIPDRDRRDALDSANGVDLVKRRVSRVLGVLGVTVVLLVVLRCLVGCAALDRAVPAIGTAHEIAKVGCALLEGTDGTTLDVLRATQDLQRAMLDASAKAAVEKGAEPDRVAQDMRTIAALAETLKIATTAIVQASGNEPARVAPCPAVTTTTITSTSTSSPEVDGGAP